MKCLGRSNQRRRRYCNGQTGDLAPADKRVYDAMISQQQSITSR
ncbi:hypothetical protein OH492_04830 [Vibrio chagasii]|nr:hypothetical protein [Vibrio chagasii]